MKQIKLTVIELENISGGGEIGYGLIPVEIQTVINGILAGVDLASLFDFPGGFNHVSGSSLY